MAAGYEIHSTPTLTGLAAYYAEEVRVLAGKPNRVHARAQLSAIEKVLRSRGEL